MLNPINFIQDTLKSISLGTINSYHAASKVTEFYPQPATNHIAYNFDQDFNTMQAQTSYQDFTVNKNTSVKPD